MFMAYEVTKQLLASLRASVLEIQKNDRELADQLYRAANSVLLNLGEGQKFQDGNRRKHYALAQGSANEVKAALDAAEAWGWIIDAKEPRVLLDRVLAMLWRLTHSEAITSLGKGGRARA
jgi:four helix bundle protein